MPHSTKSTRNEQGAKCCPYCGKVIRYSDPLTVTCWACGDLPALEPFDDRYLLDPVSRYA